MKIKYEIDSKLFQYLPSIPFAYWAEPYICRVFSKNNRLGNKAFPVEGIKTGNNDIFLRYWYEIFREKEHLTMSDSLNRMWHKMAKGGPYRKWYGNIEYVCKWGLNGSLLLSQKGTTVSNRKKFFTPAITWTYFTSGKFSMRSLEDDTLYNNKGPACYLSAEDKLYFLALTNSKPIEKCIETIAPTADCTPGNISNLPINIDNKEIVNFISKENVSISREDWDSFETSWDFKKHPLI